MNSKTIRVLVVDADPSGVGDLHSQLDQVPEIEIVGIAHSQRAALNQYYPCAETTRMVPVGSSRVELVDQVICPALE